MKSICVFCGSRDGGDPKYLETAKAAGKYLAENNIRVIYGGASIGCMGALADGVLLAGGEVIGVLPKVIAELEIAHKGLTELIATEDMLERKKKMFELSDAFLTLPGGIGTLDELFEALTWTQLHLQNKPIHLYSPNGFFDATARQIDHMIQEGFVSGHHKDLVRLISDFSEISFQPYRLTAKIVTDE